MAIRNIRKEGDLILRKKSRKIEIIDERIKILAKDMIETMYDAEGVGLAAPQIGILKRLIVVDIGDGPITIINPEIISQEGKQEEVEGCLSIPGKSGVVIRPEILVVKGIDLDGKDVQIKAKDFLARAFSHEVDHLEGILFTDKVVKYID